MDLILALGMITFFIIVGWGAAKTESRRSFRHTVNEMQRKYDDLNQELIAMRSQLFNAQASLERHRINPDV
jgi:hypothetical protein